MHAGCDSEGPNCVWGGSPQTPYGSVFAPTMPGSGGSPGSDSATPGNGYGGWGGAAVIIRAAYSEVNGTYDVSGIQSPNGCGYSSYCGGSGAGGSVFVNTSVLGPSNATLRANGGIGLMGGYSYSGPFASSGGSGGRIAVVCTSSPPANSSAAAQLAANAAGIKFEATGGYRYNWAGNLGQPSASAGTAWLDCGRRILTLDNGDKAKAATNKPTFFVENVASLQIDELRIWRGSGLRFAAPLNNLATTMVVSVTSMTGDDTNVIWLSNRTTMLLASSPVGALVTAFEPPSMVQGDPSGSVAGGGTEVTATYVRRYVLDDTTFAFWAAGASAMLFVSSRLPLRATVLLQVTSRRLS